MSYPLSTDEMYYDYDEHMYVLTADYVTKKTGVNLILMINSPYITDKNTAVKNLLTDISRQIYSFVYSYNVPYNDYQEYLMAKSEIARDLIRIALLKQLGYIIRNGKINEFVGTNVSFNQSNAATPLEDMRGARSIHPEAIQTLSRPLENGEKLLYSGRYMLPWEISYRVGY